MQQHESADNRILTTLYDRQSQTDNADTNPDGLNQQVSDANATPQLQRRISGLSDNCNLVMEGEPNDSDIEMKYVLLSSGSTSDSFTDVEWSPSFSVISRSQSSCAVCGILMQTMKCDYTKQFWRGIDEEGPEVDQRCHIKFFLKFLERLKDKFHQEEGLKSKETINLLKSLLSIDTKDDTAGVKLANVKRLTELFGPIKAEDNKCVLINQLFQLIKKSFKKRGGHKKLKTSWFVGEMTRGEAEQALLGDDCADYTYLVRISGSDGGYGDFVLSVRHNDHCHHLKIQGNPELALSETPYHAHLRFAGKKFASLPDVIDYIVNKRTIDIDTGGENEELEECSSVICLRVFPRSPLNTIMSGYEKAK